MRPMALRCSMVMAHGEWEPHTTGARSRRLQVWPVTVQMLTREIFHSLAVSEWYRHLPPLMPVLLPTYPLQDSHLAAVTFTSATRQMRKQNYLQLSLQAFQASARQQCLLLQRPLRGCRLRQRCLEWLPWCRAIPVPLWTACAGSTPGPSTWNLARISSPLRSPHLRYVRRLASEPVQG